MACLVTRRRRLSSSLASTQQHFLLTEPKVGMAQGASDVMTPGRRDANLDLARLALRSLPEQGGATGRGTLLTPVPGRPRARTVDARGGSPCPLGPLSCPSARHGCVATKGDAGGQGQCRPDPRAPRLFFGNKGGGLLGSCGARCSTPAGLLLEGGPTKERRKKKAIVPSADVELRRQRSATRRGRPYCQPTSSARARSE